MVDPTDFGYADLRFSWGDHVCAIFDEPSQQMGIMGAFMAQGLRATQRCVWVAAPPSADRFRLALGNIGGDIQTLESSSQLLIISDVDFYLQDNLFRPDRTMDLLRSLLEDGQRQGYATMRVATDVSWLRGHRMNPDIWEDFERGLTERLRDQPAVMVCQYDRRQVSGSIVVAAFRTHPIVILGDRFHHNPFYVAPEGGAGAPELI